MSGSQKSESRQALKGSVICRQCDCKFFSIVSFDVNEKMDFHVELFKSRNDQSPFVNQTFIYTEQNDLEQRCRVKCPTCKTKFELSISFIMTITDSQLKVNLSITTDQAEKAEKDKNPKDKQHNISALRRVNVFYKCSGETFRGDDQVKEQLMMDRWRTLHVQETNLEDSDIIIVFCPITSRVGSDVESCMRDETVLSSNKPVILVLMHHTRDYDYSTAGTIWSEVYPNVVLDVHVLFHETKPGLLTCRQNQEAFEMIKKELNKRSRPAIRMLTR